MSAADLTAGAIQRIRNGEQVVRPHLQILASKVADSGGSVCRLILSDGEHSDQGFAVVGEELIKRVKNGNFERFAIIQLNGYSVTNLESKVVITLNDFEVVKKASPTTKKIGAPQPIAQKAPLQANNQGVNQNSPAVKQEPRGARPGVPAANASPARANGRGAALAAHGDSPAAQMAANCCPISAINPFQGKFTIKGRCVAKSNVRSWSKPNNEGKLFNFDLKDSSGGIRVAAFKDECDKFFDLVEVGKVYLVARGTVKTANRKFCPDFEYEMNLNSDSMVELIDDAGTVPEIEFEFQKISAIENLNADDKVDIACVLYNAGVVSTVHSTRLNKDLVKRDLSVVDDSSAKVGLTLWGKDAEDFNADVGDAIIATKCKVSDFSGKSISTSRDGVFLVNPDMQIANDMRDWWQSVKDSLNPRSLTTEGGGRSRENKFMFQGYAEALQVDRVFFDSRVYVASYHRVSFYDACPGMNADRPCRKKVQMQDGGQFYCQGCNKTYPSANRRIILGVRMMDETADSFVSLFDDDVCKLFGWSESDVKHATEDSVRDITKLHVWKAVQARLSFKKEFYQERGRVKTNCQTLDMLELCSSGRRMLDQIRKIKASA